MPRRIRISVVLLLTLGLGVAACGGSGSSGTTGTPDTTSPPPATTAAAPDTTATGGAATDAASGDPAAGKTVFESTCAACHTLSDAGATGTSGPNLDQVKPDEARVANQVQNGGATMPAFGRDGTLDPTQVADVAAYVASAAGG